MQNYKKSIFFVITGLGPGGAEKTLVELISELTKLRRFEIHVYALTNLNFFQPALKDLGVTVKYIPIGFNCTWIIRTVECFCAMRRHRPIVSTWLYHADIFGGVLAKIAGIKDIIWSARQSNLSFRANSLSIYLLIRVCAAASHFIPRNVISCAFAAKDSHLSLGYKSSSLRVIHNGYDHTKYPKLCKKDLAEKYSKAERFRIIHIGRNDVQKNQFCFLQVADLVSREFPNAEFLLIGSRVKMLENTLDFKQFSNIKLGKNLFLEDETKHLEKVLKTCHCLVQTSLGEGFPNVVAEACLAGVPVVATDVGDTKLILGGTIDLVTGCEPEVLAATVIQVLNKDLDSLIDLIYENQNFVKNNYSLDKMTQQYLDAFGV